MKIMQRGGVLAGLLAAAIAMPVAAEDYPNKDLQYIVPFGPGGEVDISARLQQPLFQEAVAPWPGRR